MTLKRNSVLLNRKFNEYLVPAVLSAMSILLASFIDGIIVSDLISPDALSAVYLSDPVILFFQAVYFLFGIGGLISISEALGNRDNRKANILFTLAVVGSVISSVLVTVFGTLFTDGVVSLICNEEMLTDMVTDYVRYSFIGSSMMIIVPAFSFFIRVDGQPKLASAILITSNAINLVMDFVYIKVFGMGIKGAALATVTGYVVGLGFVFYYLCFSKTRSLRFVMPGTQELKLMGELCTSGISSVLNTALLFVKSVLLNRIVISVASVEGIIAFSVCNMLLTFISMFVSGGADTMTPIVSMLFGDRDLKGIKMILKRTLILVLGSCSAVAAFVCIFPETVLGFFSFDTPEMLEAGVPAVRIFTLSLLGMSISYIMMNYFQSTKHKPLSVMITLLRGLLITVPLAWGMGNAFGAEGVWWAIFISEMLTAATVFAVSYVISKRRSDKYSSILLFEKNAEDAAEYEVSLEADAQQAVSVSESISEFALANSVPQKTARYAGLLSEETVEHIRRFNTGKKPVKIDLFCKVLPDKLILTVRDNGALFDPAKTDEDAEEFSNLKMINSIAENVEYSRAIGLNNMLVELRR